MERKGVVTAACNY